jgi:hypothetical protein
LKKQKDAQLSWIKSQLNQIQWNKDLASVQAWNTRIEAPYSWVIVDKLWNLWQVIWMGTPVYSIADTSNLKIKVYIPESQIWNINIYDNALIYISSYWEYFSGQVTNISPMADISSKKIPVEIQIENPDWKLKIWMYWTVNIWNNTQEGSLVPYDFVKYEYWKAYVKSKDSQWKLEKKYLDIFGCNNQFCLLKNEEMVWEILVK